MRILLFLLLCLQQIALTAQDTLVKKNNERVVGKILEVNPDNVKYKRTDYLTGPTFTIEKKELKYILYSNGTKDSFENYVNTSSPLAFVPQQLDLTIQPAGKYYYFQNKKITEQDMLDIAWKQQDKKIKLFVKKTEDLKIGRNCFLLAGIVTGTAGLLTFVGAFSPYKAAAYGTGIRSTRMAARSEFHATGRYLLLGALTCEVVSYVFYIKEKHNAHLVVDLYNNSVAVPVK